ncbi:MAG: hypothetical protein OEQ53_09830, partial [Saprospiraceae bacterium]|nr:hypothetical protein [Saprospiraceae bacterium]
GFSLGGNVIIKFTAIKRHQLKRIKAVIAISTPCDLASSSKALDRWDNQIYSWRFRRSLLKKFKQKALQYPNLLELSKFDKVKTWHDFDNVFTTKLTGFRDADEYYAQGSANNFLAYVTVPTFILNATNDPFLEEPSYPRRIANESPFIHLEMPKYGGHVGYWYPGRGQSYAEERCLAFLEEFVSKS